MKFIDNFLKKLGASRNTFATYVLTLLTVYLAVDRIVEFLVNIRDIVKIFKDYKIQEVKPINIEVEEVKEILC